ncbi:hypothetical protein H8E88_33465 [candidate division KSB1 bacterium]|nr:hypothetical protein [candidate division KSB1 bacterium]MBL7095865.1 hypothetical protein [candidate division KSB1 bacterium]
MAVREVSWKVSDKMYNEMTQVQKELSFSSLKDMVSLAVQRYLAEIRHETWWIDFRKLQQQVRTTGGFKLGQTKEELIANLREQRRQIFESDYENMY